MSVTLAIRFRCVPLRTLRSASTAAAAAPAEAASSTSQPVAVAHKATGSMAIKERPWGPASVRVGMLGVKCGMTRGWDALGKQLPLTVVKVSVLFNFSCRIDF
jgi:hypothetical protein